MAPKWTFLGLVCLVSLGFSHSFDYDEDKAHPFFLPIEPLDINKEELTNEYWHKQAGATIAAKLQEKLRNTTAKNIIMFLGDGMSLHTVAAARSLSHTEKDHLSFEKFPHFGLSKTYCVDKQVADSACTATAYLSGVKGNYGTIGVNGKVVRHDCILGQDKRTFTESIAVWAHKAGKQTGIVTTARVTHASPAGMYAHTANRDWESDAGIVDDGCNPKENIDIAQQLVHWDDGKMLKVVLGGGRSNFRDSKKNDEQGKPGWRTDGRDLIEEWLEDRSKKGNASYVWNRKGLQSIDVDNTDYVLGLFSQSHCSYHGDIARDGLTDTEPALSEMTLTAINLLKNNKEGYFLFVEGARIDMAHHDTKTRKALEDTEEFAKAIDLARKQTSEDDTLIIVTSDHAHTMTINGYPVRGSDILGLSGDKGSDNLPYTTLSYANGPGYYNTYLKEGGGRHDLSHEDFTNPNYEYPATVPLDSETHGGDDVGIYASGPRSHIFIGNYEQNNIPVLMAYAAEIGPYQKQSPDSAAAISGVVSLVIALVGLVYIL